MNVQLRQLVVLVAIVVAALAPVAMAQEKPASPEDRPVSASSDSQGGGSKAGGFSGAIDWAQAGQTAGALAIVVALIFATRYLLRRLGGRRGLGGECDLIEVLGQTSLSSRYQLMLVRLGSRLVLIGASGQSLTRLSEITDPAEVASLTRSAENVQRKSLKDLFRPSAKPAVLLVSSGSSKQSLDASDGDGQASSVRVVADRLRARLVGKED